MSKRFFVLLLIAVFLQVQAQQPDNPMQRAVQKILDESVASGHQTAEQVCVYIDGKLVVDAWAGTYERGGKKKIDGNSLFPIFSTEKPVFVTAAHILHDQGKLDYDKRVCDYWPEFGCKGKDRMTMRHLLSHRSSFPRGSFSGVLPREKIADWNFMIKFVADQPVDKKYPPGTRTKYLPQIYGWALGEPLCRITGMKINDLLRELVLIPAGIEKDFYFSADDEAMSRIVTVYATPQSDGKSGKFNPDIVRPEGEIDPEIPLLAVKQAGEIKLLLASIVNHSDTIGGTGVSADWSGFLRRILEPELGTGAMVCTLLGAEGNINHFDVHSKDKQNSYDEAERLGTGYAETIRTALPQLKPVDGETMTTLFGDAVVPPREISAGEIAEAQRTIAKYPDTDINVGTLTSEDLAKGAPAVLKYFASALLEKSTRKEKMHLYLTGILFGSSFVIASLPSEPFTEIGLTLRKDIFGGRICMVTALADGTGTYTNESGYIPNAWNYGRGGYEDQPRSNPYSMKTSGAVLQKWREIAGNI